MKIVAFIFLQIFALSALAEQDQTTTQSLATYNGQYQCLRTKTSGAEVEIDLSADRISDSVITVKSYNGRTGKVYKIIKAVPTYVHDVQRNTVKLVIVDHPGVMKHVFELPTSDREPIKYYGPHGFGEADCQPITN